MKPSTPEQFGLLGRSLKHSYSVMIHAKLGDYPYALYEVEPEQVEHFIKHGSFKGINVTIPYKEVALKMADEATYAAQTIGAANVLYRRDDGTLLADNTDYAGFKSLLKFAGVDVKDRHVLILGAGGASKTALQVAKDSQAKTISIASRKGPLTLKEATKLTDVDVVINATPVGMYPQTGIAPLDLDTLCENSPELSAVIDMIYNPAQTELIRVAREHGIRAVSGMRMLIEQARVAAELFTGASISEDVVSRIHEDLMHETLNIALIGMPSAGKSSVGIQLSHLLQRPLYDIDEVIVKEQNRSIDSIFSEEGEEHFRDVETSALSHIARLSGAVIVCGGGIVERPWNRELLHQNSVIVHLKRDMSKLSLEKRPLGATTTIERLAERRMERYQAWADLTIDNDAQLHKTAEAIKREFFELSLIEYR